MSPHPQPCGYTGAAPGSKNRSPAPPSSSIFPPSSSMSAWRLLPPTALGAARRNTLLAKFWEFFSAPCHINTGLGIVTTININYNKGKTAFHCHFSDAVITNISGNYSWSQHRPTTPAFLTLY